MNSVPGSISLRWSTWGWSTYARFRSTTGILSRLTRWGSVPAGTSPLHPGIRMFAVINGAKSEQTDHSMKITKLIKNALPLKHSDTVGDGDDESTSSKSKRNEMRRSSSSPGTGLTGSWFNGLMSVMHLSKESSSDGNGKIKTKHRRGSGHGNGNENQLKPLSDWNRKLSHHEIMEDSEMVDDDAGLHRIVPSEDLLAEKKVGSGRKSIPAGGRADLGPRPTIAKLCEFTSGSDSTIDESSSKNTEACNLFKTQIARHRKLFDLSTKTLDMSQSKEVVRDIRRDDWTDPDGPWGGIGQYRKRSG